MTLDEFREIAEEAFASYGGNPPEPGTQKWAGDLERRIDAILRERGIADGAVPQACWHAFFSGYYWLGPGYKADEIEPALRPWWLAGNWLGR